LIILDASAALFALLNDGEARQIVAAETVGVPHLADSEVANALRAQARRGRIAPEHAEAALTRWARLGLRRFAAVDMLDRIWELRENLTAYDATYVALAEAVTGTLVTADLRLALAPGPTCQVTVVRT
jgi:predicted nucleic acid-binding protein